jgi:hypothetical protein
MTIKLACMNCPKCEGNAFKIFFHVEHLRLNLEPGMKIDSLELPVYGAQCVACGFAQIHEDGKWAQVTLFMDS